MNYNGNYGVWKYVICKGRTAVDSALAKLHEVKLTNREKEHAAKLEGDAIMVKSKPTHS